LELALWLESDRMMSLNVNEENLENQRQVVMEERRQRYDNAPYGTVYEELYKRAFIKHPYRWTTIGSMEHIAAATLSDVQHFFKTYYAPNNATLVISGDITPDAAREKIEKYFAAIPTGNSFSRPSPDDDSLTTEIRDTVYDNIQLPAIFTAYRICAGSHDDADAISVLSMILSDGRSSRLYRKLVHELQLAQSVSTYAAANEHPGLFHINLVATPDADLARLESAMHEELQKIIHGDLSEFELEKAKNAVEMMLTRTLSSTMGIADTLAYFHTFFGEATLINSELKRASAVSLADVQRVAKQYFDVAGKVVLTWLPRKAAR
jgi:zinc protease